jgi:hypothetical protein
MLAAQAAGTTSGSASRATCRWSKPKRSPAPGPVTVRRVVGDHYLLGPQEPVPPEELRRRC